MKNIWFINEYDLPPEFSKFRRRYDMCKYIDKEKYRCHVICSSIIHGTLKHAYNKKTKIYYEKININILKGMQYNSNIKRVISMIFFMLKVIFFKFPKTDKPDLIYASSPHLFSALGALILARRYKVKYILEIRDLWPETWVQMKIIKRNGIIHKFFRALERYLYINANKIVYLDPNFEYMEKLRIDLKKIVYISNGVDLNKFDKDKLNKKTKIFDEKCFNITYTGAIGKANNLDVMLDLAKIIKNENIIFNIFGYGPLKEKLEKRGKNEKIENVIFHEAVPKEVVPGILSQSDLLIMGVLPLELYKYGASFNKLFEYWASSKPILFYGEIYPNYILESKSGISTPNNDILALKEACLKLYNMSEEERKELGKNGRIYVEKYFDWKILANKVEKVIEETLKGE